VQCFELGRVVEAAFGGFFHAGTVMPQVIDAVLVLVAQPGEDFGLFAVAAVPVLHLGDAREPAFQRFEPNLRLALPAVAVVAVIFFNYFKTRIKAYNQEMIVASNQLAEMLHFHNTGAAIPTDLYQPSATGSK